MNRLKQYLDDPQCRGAVRSAGGEVRLFRRRGVADLYELSASEPGFLRGGAAADKVVGRGAALLFVRGAVAELYARVISTGALSVLRRAGMRVEYGEEVPHIVNRAGTGICPVERLTAATDDPDEAFLLIKQFVETQKQER